MKSKNYLLIVLCFPDYVFLHKNGTYIEENVHMKKVLQVKFTNQKILVLEKHNLIGTSYNKVSLKE